MSRLLSACLLVTVLVLSASADEKKVKSSLVLRYAFALDKKGQIIDATGNGRDGKLTKGKISARSGILELKGEGHIAVAGPRLDPTGKPLVIGALCLADTSRGVVAAMGGEEHGFSLYLKEGVPTFALRIDGKQIIAQAEKRVAAGRWVHLMGVLDADGRARLWVDGRPSGDAVTAGRLTKQSAEGLSIGADTGSLVGDYKDEQHWTGRLKDLRLYWGPVSETEVEKWAKLPE